MEEYTTEELQGIKDGLEGLEYDLNSDGENLPKEKQELLEKVSDELDRRLFPDKFKEARTTGKNVWLYNRFGYGLYATPDGEVVTGDMQNERATILMYTDCE
jgi:hypothetical protein